MPDAHPSEVLIVDDDTAIRETLRFILEDAGYTVHEAGDGAAALEVLRASVGPMVVLLDLMMPHVTGQGVVAAVESEGARLRRHAYILMTASRATLPLSFAQQLTALNIPYLQKPVDIDDVLSAARLAAERVRHGARP